MKGKRTDLGSANCAIARSLQIIGDWWSLLIVRDAFHGKTRFSEFGKSLGLAKNILSSRLKKLVENGIFLIEGQSHSPSVRHYVLSEKGRRLAVVMVAIWQWGEQSCFEPGELGNAMVDREEGERLATLTLTARDGRLLGPGDFTMRPVAEMTEPQGS